jgi:general stress protein 26
MTFHASANSDPSDALWNLIRDFKFALLTTRSAQGRLRSRPMTTQNRRDDSDTLCFFVAANGELADDVRHDARVAVAYVDAGADRYVSISGPARFIDDQRTKQGLWSPMAQAWFPAGAADAGLLEVRIETAEYWDAKSSKMVRLVQTAAAAMRGTPPHDLGEQRSIDVSG